MRGMIISFGFFLMLQLTSLSITSIAKKQILREELNEAVSLSIRNTMELWVENMETSEEELIDNFIKVFKTTVNSDSTFNIYIYEIDTENGLLDVEVEAHFQYPNKKAGMVSARKTMIYEEKFN